VTLKAQARAFSSTLARILNKTVTRGISLQVILDREQGGRVVGWLGYQVSRSNLVGQPIPLTVSPAPPSSYLWIGQTLMVEEDTGHLVTRSAQVALCTDPDGEDQLFRYDYNREPSNDYPAAHLQVYGLNQPWLDFCAARGYAKPTERLHFPVGGRRFRPSLEDIVEFLIVEKLVSFHDAWQEGLAEGRQRWDAVQVMAAVRARPADAAEQLRQLGYAVDAPQPS